MIATTIEQSKHLLELGLSPDSADMWWSNRFIYWQPTPMIGISAEQHQLYTFKWCDVDVPAWSLSALLEMIPSSAYIDCKMQQDGFGYWGCVFEYDGDVKVRHRTIQSTSSGKPDPVSTAYAMVTWLLEQGLIKKGGQDESDN